MCGYTVSAHPIGMHNGFDQVFRGVLNFRLCRGVQYFAMLLWFALAAPANAETCLPPTVPFVPNDPAAQREFADLIRRDFETYITDVQEYFRCLDAERARAFDEAREVSNEYGRFLQEMSQ